MSTFTHTPLGDCCEIVSGATPKTGVDKYWDGDVLWATPRDLSDLRGIYIDDTLRKITEAGLKSCAASILPAGSVLFSSRAPIGHVAINTRPLATNQGFKSFIPKADRVDAKYLAYWLKANRPYLENLGNGATFKEVSKATIAKVKIPLPSLGEQRRIAQVLDSVDALRAKRRRAIALLDDLAQSIFLDTFGDPTTNPKRWEVESLGNLARVIRGASPRPKGDPKYFGGPIPWLMISDVTRSPGDTVTKIREGVTAAGRDKSVYLKAGTLILTNSATVGLPKFLGVDACIHDGFLAILDISNRIDPIYLYQLFRQNREKVSSLAPEGTQKNLNTGIAKGLSIPVPPLATQRAFRMSIEQINLLRSAHQAHLLELDALFASLQCRAFRGELWDSPAA